MINKTKLTETLTQFPEQFTIDEIMDKLILMDKIEKGNYQSKNQETISEESLEIEMQKWFK